MTEDVRHEIVQRHQSGMSMSRIAQELGISRGAVARVLAKWRARRDCQDGQVQSSPKRQPRRSIMDAFEPILKELLQKYPNLTIQRAVQELRARGFTGKYTVVRQRMALLRPREPRVPVPRFETEPGAQAQMDFGVYDIDFTHEGRRRVFLFSYLLGYSRRQYLRWVEAMDLPTTLQEHVRAFHHLGGACRVCLYDNFKAVVLRHDADGVLYNPKFLAFATHYGFRPQACRVRRPQTKGKVERQFHFVEINLLNGRDFDTLEHLNLVTAQWLSEIADTRVLRDFGMSPLERHAVELPHLLPLPTCDFDTAQVFYRHVNVEGFVTHRLNHYSVPYSYIGQVLPIRVTDREIIIYSISLEEVTRHALAPRTATGMRQRIKSHHPVDDPTERERLLRQRFHELGPVATRFLDGLLAKQAQGKLQAQQLLSILSQYSRDDVLRAFERAVRFGAYSLMAMRRILAARAKPRPLLDGLADHFRESLDPSLREEPIGPRPTSEYQHLLSTPEQRYEQDHRQENKSHKKSHETSHDDSREEPDQESSAEPT